MRCRGRAASGWRWVEVGAELREGLEARERRQVEAQRAGELLHRLRWALPPTRDTEIPT